VSLRPEIWAVVPHELTIALPLFQTEPPCARDGPMMVAFGYTLWTSVRWRLGHHYGVRKI